ncbi:winged helix-turn-helix transcriptional regulator [Devosia sp.]|uniref:winged helix-turn-helix transcriptional regulator n=1 Tax=Devosia sp. TaxID=1871048 RepID=UPI001AC0DCB8|nr:winged helix-turn-helix transcriptional regulator [Devosia sp.]MBN9332214.1 MarR family transcriptional regulator [Devosia sp.]
MLIKIVDLEAIADGRIDTQFRRWRRPTVKAGGTMLTALGILSIDAVEPVTEDISDEDAHRAGFADAKGLVASLATRGEGQLYRIRLHHMGADPRIALRTSLDDLAEVEVKLARMDGDVPWTRAVLASIAENPGLSAQQLADSLGLERQAFKTRVRRLKALGLTESLETGYRISPRGTAILGR